MIKARSTPPKRPAGFTLVEVMVAMVIGMIGIIIMMQVFATAEGQKRTTTGTGDAQSNGATALYELQRNIRQSGYGINSMSLLNCSLDLGAPSNATLPALGPAIINPQKADKTALLPAGDANTDTLLVAFGSSAVSAEGDTITDVIRDVDLSLAVLTATSFKPGDRAIAGLAGETAGCALTLAEVREVKAPRVTVATGGAAAGGLLFNLGAPTIQAYAIRNGNLTVCNYMLRDCGSEANKGDATIWIPIANNIVSLRAQYGRDTTKPMDGVDTWDQTTPTTACEWVRAAALRIAVVARNSQVDKDEITAAAPTWEGSGTAALKLDETRDNWKHYRYKVFETVVPIRNLSWVPKC